jgi:hypothetical protein
MNDRKPDHQREKTADVQDNHPDRNGEQERIDFSGRMVEPARHPLCPMIIFRGQQQHCVSESGFRGAALRQAGSGTASVNVSN